MLHTFVDGVAIATSFAVNARMGFLVLAAIVLHKLPEGLAIGSLFVATGRSVRAGCRHKRCDNTGATERKARVVREARANHFVDRRAQGRVASEHAFPPLVHRPHRSFAFIRATARGGGCGR